jgi:DNA-binding MarR family transcriptional regulator
MLDDNARKILMLLWHTIHHEPSMIDISYLCHRSQRNETQVKEAINLLVKEGYVLWDKGANTFRVIYTRESEKHPKAWGWNK